MNVSAIVTLFLSVVLYIPAAHSEDDRLTLSGSSTVAPLISEIARRYEADHPGIRIDVQTGGSARAINDTRMGMVDIGMVSRSPAAQRKRPYKLFNRHGRYQHHSS